MRLIDADKFAIEEPKLWDWSSVDGISSVAVLKQCIWDVQCAPTVEAITVKWIERFMNRFRTSEGVSGDEYALIHYMLCEWEKENENRKGEEDK